MLAVTLPAAPDASWLTTALHASGALPRGEVLGVTVRDSPAFNAQVRHLALRYSADAPADAPRALLLKTLSGGDGAHEVGWYQYLAARGLRGILFAIGLCHAEPIRRTVMITIAQPFARATQAREAMLELLTSGVPRPDIGVMIGPLYTDQPTPVAGQTAAGDDDYAAETLAGLDDSVTYSFPDGGVMTAVGLLAEALSRAAGEAAEVVYQDALLAVGAPAAEARAWAQQLGAGGALVAVCTDRERETVVRGVFNHALNPMLNNQQELQGPEADRDDEGGLHEPPGASVGALSGGMIPGGWGSAGVDLLEDTEDDNHRPSR